MIRQPNNPYASLGVSLDGGMMPMNSMGMGMQQPGMMMMPMGMGQMGGMGMMPMGQMGMVPMGMQMVPMSWGRILGQTMKVAAVRIETEPRNIYMPVQRLSSKFPQI